MTRLASTSQAVRRVLAGARAAASAGGRGEGPETSGRSFSATACDIEQELLDKALQHVKAHGWTASALHHAARDMALSPSVVGILPRREGQLVEHFVRTNNKALSEALKEQADALKGMPVKDRIRHAVKTRLMLVVPYLDSWPQALATASLPSNFPHSANLLMQLVDDIWYAAGDTSTDTSYYSKRLSLAAVYSVTELFLLTDYSPHFQDTWQALDRRLHDVLVLGKAVSDISQSVAKYAEAAKAGAAAP